ncbi:prolyl 4-hydroxylase subunit alpha-2-like [Erpetoichthys calabaricus]|uniref:procollagen-proline 4-dioxygenase n=1 Tax=Erpetoichthys calabaricus TaxID=27687 RepID=A0A8C4S7I7_ERPCA|nr:prolyl 4-hydroxylase subunit alpha-2-like [Erpetoichthys calabaricus]
MLVLLLDFYYVPCVCKPRRRLSGLYTWDMMLCSALCWMAATCWLVTSTQTEFYSSIGQMTDLIYLERSLLLSLKDYIREEQLHIERLQHYVQILQEMSEFLAQDPEGHVSNPVAAFKLVKRVKWDWMAMEQLVRQDPSHGFLDNLTMKSQFLPANNEIEGIAMGLIRLQETYQLLPETIAEGRLPGVKYLETLSPDDSYFIAKIALKENNLKSALLWMQHTLKQLDEGQEAVVQKTEVLNSLCSLVFQVGDLAWALELTRQLNTLDPGDVKTASLLDYFEKLANSVKQQSENKVKGANLELFQKPPNIIQDKDNYEALCRGERIRMTPKKEKNLVCRFNNGNFNPRLLLAPIKEEEEWDRPLILRYHDFMSDDEIKTIKFLSQPKLARAGVSDRKTGGQFIAEYRVSKSAWLREEDHLVVFRLNQRIADVTGLSMESAEPLQVANYGVGGQYEPHYDFPRIHVNDTVFKLNGSRIATLLIYMSDVEAGGATVFPDVGAALQPIKGTAVFWYNVLKNGEDDYSTLHGACPVLVGSKWVSNKWIRVRGQEFRRPCGLSETE